MAKNEVVIFDLDNCLSDDNHRVHLIDKSKTGDARYEAYHANMGKDKLNPEALRILHGHNLERRRIFILTARPGRYRQATTRWLIANEINHDELIMRPDGNHGTSVKVKGTMLGWMNEHYGVDLKNIVAAYDDRQDVIDMYLQNGITAIRLACNLEQACCEAGRNPAYEWTDETNPRCYEKDTGKVIGTVATTGVPGRYYAVSRSQGLGEYITLEHAKRAVESEL